ncbi:MULTISPECIES: ROK family transcriptional regulator [Clostridium]|uniref:NBD/HSP70 family sugar kinase/biotin operon repressor n=1 Tax=Clostridium beijerinckii TaxID=1520 RepID=A0A9Q5CUV5_CLOBE|nr:MULTISPECIES: ROK family transcriptional regulator [Clostridium]AQS05127.1 N-acetylglucosamine repressor [Clostridium beijerinckii]MBA2888557.1 putative NBD/HSP70 family sugar kinase/biotin operon repressor [Clostridium beijerinckii]MBA2902988.1 putative NBD/HSP70 family sugar kinase/biotin operon repressor [Clostridium beijerinckii]MBA2913170.1 putative NBD/HSP70 family sugar kinase/biotin operon repressor [Clostridium beijerinckii]MBA9015302.1 putative NBD/HSP70 family sugar kinase/biotin
MIEVNHSKIKETNRKKIIALLLKKNEITKLDISRILDISITTVSTNITELKSEGIVEDVRSLESTGGRKAIAIKLNENCRYSIGVALTPNHIKISLVNIKKKVIESMRVRHNSDGIENIINLLNENIDLLMKKYNLCSANLLGIGISLPGTVDFKEGIIKYSYLLGAKDFNLKEKFEYLDIPVYVDNEANLSAYYEFLNKRDILRNLLYVSITEGLGLGIIINGKIYRGDNNSSGELGHTKIAIDGKKCKCGARGCLEAYTSMNSLIDSYNEANSSNISDIDEFEERYNKNDKDAHDVLNDYLKTLSLGLSNLVMIFDPSSIVIGGDINNLLNDKIDMLKKEVYKDNLFTNENNCSISIASFKESYLLGAAMMPIEEFLEIK